MKLPQGTMRGLLAGSLFHELAAEAASKHKISPNAVLVLLAAEELHYKNQPMPTVELVQLQMGLTLPAVRRAVGQLHRAGLLAKSAAAVNTTVSTTNAGFTLLKQLSSACWSETLSRLKSIRVLRKDVHIFRHE